MAERPPSTSRNAEKLTRSAWKTPTAAPSTSESPTSTIGPSHASTAHGSHDRTPRSDVTPVKRNVPGRRRSTPTTASVPSVGASIIATRITPAPGVRRPRPLNRSGEVISQAAPDVTTRKVTTAGASTRSCAEIRAGTLLSAHGFIVPPPRG